MSELLDAITAGDGDAALRVLEDPAVETTGEGGPSPLLQAHYRGMADVVQAIRALRPLDLPEAAAVGDLPSVARLLAENVPADTRSADGFTPLQLACHFDQAGAAALLVRAGADVAA